MARSQVVVATAGWRAVAMAGRRRSDRALRGKLRSPGRPGVARREDRRRFWAFIAAGLSSEDAAMEVGVSQPVGFSWFREAGGLPEVPFESAKAERTWASSTRSSRCRREAGRLCHA